MEEKMIIKAAVSQFNIKPGNLNLNLQAMELHMGIAARSQADLIVLPELWNCGYDLANLPRLAQTLNGPIVIRLKELAKKHRLFIFAGSIAEKKDRTFYNTALAIDSKGNLVGKYRKIHLFPLGFEEDKFFSGGEDWGLIETPWGMIGIVICYDLRFPELVRNLVLRGARIIIVPSQWPESAIDHWVTLCKARAIENQVYIIGANRTGLDGTIQYSGKSLIVSPWGNVIIQGKDNPEVLIADIDTEEIEKARETLPDLSCRCSILDEIDNSQF